MIKKKTIVYIHGFNSWGQATKSQLLKQALEDHLLAYPEKKVNYYSPTLIHHPLKAMKQLRTYLDACQNENEFCFVGSSLGGFYSIYLAHHYEHAQAVLINPALEPWKTMDSYYGDYENPCTGEKFTVTEEFVVSLEQFQCHSILNPQRFFVLLQEDDEIIDYRIAKEFFSHSPHIIRNGGGHSFRDFQVVLPEVLAFCLD